MKRLLCLLLALLASPAAAQTPLTANSLGQVQMPPQTVLGNSLPVAGPLNALPFSLVAPSSAPPLAAVNPLPLATTEMFRATTNELVTMASGGTVNLLNISPGVPGYVVGMHFDVQITAETTAGFGVQNGVLKVFVDGELTPSVQTDMAGMMATGANASTMEGKWSTTHVTYALAQSGTSAPWEVTYEFNFPIPFKSSILVTYTAATDTGLAQYVWSDISYRIGSRPPYKLWSSNTPVTAAQTFTGATVTSATCSISLGLNSLTCSGASFVASDVTKRIAVLGAGTPGQAGGSLYTTITSVNSGTNVSLLDNAATGVSSQIAAYGRGNLGNGTVPALNVPSGSGAVVWHGINYICGGTVPNSFLEANMDMYLDGAPRLGGGVGTNFVNISIASPAVITWAESNLSAGNPVTFSTTGALPSGITAGTTYFVIASGLTANSFQISATPGGTAINTSGTQSGNQFATVGQNPQVSSNGTEDYFGSGFYFGQGVGSLSNAPYQQNTWQAVTNLASGVGTIGFDFLQAFGGVAFNNGIYIVPETGPNKFTGITAITTCGVAWTILYYLAY